MQISGLSSGIDTTSMVKQLMQVERLAGSSFTKGRTTSQALVSAYNSLNTAIKKIGDATEAFVPKSVTQTAAWSAVKATSSVPTTATVSATDKAQAGTITFSVERLAQAGSAISGTEFGAEDKLNGGAAFSFEITVGEGDKAKAHTIAVGPDSRLADVVDTINQQAGTDVRASMVQVASGTYKLQLTSAQTGANSNVNVTNGATPPVASDVLGDFSKVAEGRDTELRIGDKDHGFIVTSPTREVKDILPGVTITPLKAAPGESVTIDIATDVDGMSGKVDAMVKAANEAISNIRINSGYNRDNPSLSGAFVGNSMTRDLASRIPSAITAGGVDPSTAGISIDRNGSITFDKDKFATAYAADPEKVQATVNKIAENLGNVSTQASDSRNGQITAAIKGQQDMIKDYGDRIKAFDLRMEARESTLTAQFNAMESMLSKMQAQGNWLQGQLAGLYSGM